MEGKNGGHAMKDSDLVRMCRDAGVLPSEMVHDPVHGWLLSAAAVRKLAAKAPDQDRAQTVRDMVADVVRSGFKAIDGGCDGGGHGIER
jgi:hypothetical protein